MNISLLSFYSPAWQPLADIILPNRQKYCEKHDYNCKIRIGPYANPNWYYAIDRLVFLYDQLLAGDSDVIWILNIHAMIMNASIKIESFLDDEHDFFICKDIHGINAGSFICKNTEWTRSWLKMIIKEALIINHCWHEQKVMQDNENDPHIKILPHPSINSYYYDLYNCPTTNDGQFHKGDFVLHLPGTSLDERIKIFTSERVKNDTIS
jgi:hypothetical protein